LKDKVNIAGFLFTFTGAVLFSTKAIIVKKAFADIHTDALTLLMLRMLCALPFYLASIYFTSQNQQHTPLTKRQWIQLILLGLFGYYLSSWLDFEGLQYVSAGLERLILFLYPTFVVLINTFFFQQKITRTQKMALMLTYTGIGIAYFGELSADMSNPNFFWGSLLIFICAVTYAVYLVGSGKLIPQIGASRFTVYSMLTATACVFIHFALKNNWSVLHEGGSQLWIYSILLAIIATVIPSFLLSAGMKRIGSNNVAIISSIGPVSTIVQAHFVLGEKIFAAQVAGTVLVIAGVLLIGWKARDTAV
jgi:drug/metabolite transporter (DMT)-like permease